MTEKKDKSEVLQGPEELVRMTEEATETGRVKPRNTKPNLKSEMSAVTERSVARGDLPARTDTAIVRTNDETC